MHDRSSVSPTAESTSSPITCVFCQQTSINPYILKETPHFRLVTDHAPLVEGHILIIPKTHYACYGDVPASLDTELFALKHEAQRFLQQYYDTTVFWEHGVFHQTVFHAHLHCFPFGTLTQSQTDLCQRLSAEVVQSQDEIRAWYVSRGYYFYLEPGAAYLFAPQDETYGRVIHDIFWTKVSARTQQQAWRSTQQRRQEAGPWIASTFAKWREFERQEDRHE
jgi:diadenosine tetraphosphate (Ap4A) HIT family hydrolase